MQVSVYNQSGKEVEKLELSDYVFGAPFNEAVVHQAMLRQQANARQGTASTKTRSEVSGSSRKLFKQKGTGNARAGSIKSGLRPGGGILFGPKPRDYRQAMPKKMRQLAIRCALSAKVRDNELVVLKDLGFEQPKTKEMVNVLKALEASSTALIVMDNPEENVIKSTRNIAGVKTMQSRLLNVVDILSHKKILITVAAVKNAEELWGENATKGDSNGTV
jgi:large subunit ribosomal protein L4